MEEWVLLFDLLYSYLKQFTKHGKYYKNLREDQITQSVDINL